MARASTAPAARTLDLPPSEPAAVRLGDVVIVVTPRSLAGQIEHAAVVTKVHDDGALNVLLLPAEGEPYPIPRLLPLGTDGTTSARWRRRD